MTRYHIENLTTYKRRIVQQLLLPEFSIYHELKRLHDMMNAAYALSEFELVEYYNACFEFLNGYLKSCCQPNYVNLN